MTKMCQFPAFRTLILGATMAGGLVSLTAQSQAMMTADEFLASITEMKRICRVLNEPFYTKRYNYGCGKYVCKGRKCHAKRKPPRRPNDPPVLTHVPGTVTIVESKSDGGDNGGNNDNGRGGNNGPNHR